MKLAGFVFGRWDVADVQELAIHEEWVIEVVHQSLEEHCGVLEKMYGRASKCPHDPPLPADPGEVPYTWYTNVQPIATGVSKIAFTTRARCDALHGVFRGAEESRAQGVDHNV